MRQKGLIRDGEREKEMKGERQLLTKGQQGGMRPIEIYVPWLSSCNMAKKSRGMGRAFLTLFWEAKTETCGGLKVFGQ